MRSAVVGHLEWVDFVRVDRLPRGGEIVRALEASREPAGGGPVAAVQLAKLAGDCTFFTALGDDELGRRACEELARMGVRVEAVFRDAPTRRAVTFIERSGERTITVIGDRLSPSASDPLPWEELAETDAVYVCACDAEAMRAVRKARVLVATSRIIVPVVRDSGVVVDALVGSAFDPSEEYREADLPNPPRLVVRTEGAKGGTYATEGEPSTRYEPAPLPGALVDTYGCGDSFAAGLAFTLAEGRSHADGVAFAARCGAAVATGRGPYESQLTKGA